MGIETNDIVKKSDLTPKLLFDFLVNGITAMAEGQHQTPDDNVRFNIFESNEQEFEVTCLQATEEEYQAFMVLREKMQKNNKGAFPCRCDTLMLTVWEQGVIIRTRFSESVVIKADGTFSNATYQKPWKNFVYYGDGKLYCRNEMHSKDKVWPCTMKDLFESELLSQRCVCLLIMEFFAQAHIFWSDLVKDFVAGSAYSSIPLLEIWDAHSREELLKNHYGFSMKRNNKETIGQGIFLAQARRIVKENEMQKLYGFHPGRVYIGRKKSDLAYPLADFILQNCPDVGKPIKLPHDRSVTVDKSLVVDAIKTEILLRRKISVTFYSPRGIYDWHNEASRIYRSRKLDTVKIPTDSKFKKLHLPPNCVRLTSRRQFIEEGDFQDNCVSTYIPEVNSDYCSIWSMRKEDGTRNTIEIRSRRSKNNPQGYFYIAQMMGFGNSDPPDEDYELIREALSRQQPYRP